MKPTNRYEVSRAFMYYLTEHIERAMSNINRDGCAHHWDRCEENLKRALRIIEEYRRISAEMDKEAKQ